jgi:hypothetical protein
MYCPNCAATIDGVKFCRSCGKNVSLIPQVMSGRLPQSDDAQGNWRQGHHHLDWGHRRRLKKEQSIERAVNCFFSGIGFLLAAMFVAYFSPRGFRLEWAFLSKSAEEYSIHSASLDGDEFGIVGASTTIYSRYKAY